jgi:hypothetical protein
MPLQYQPVDIPLARGFNSRADAKTMEPVHLTQLTNGVLDKPGAITKREGYSNLATTIVGGPGTVSTTLGGKTLHRHKNSLVAANEYELFQYSDSADKWSYNGTYYGWAVNSSVVAPSSVTYQSSLPSAVEVPCSTASLNNYVVTAWYQNSYSTQRGVWYQITDAVTGAVLVPPTRKTTISASVATTVCVVAMTTTILIVYPNIDNGKVECFTLDVTSGSNLNASLDDAVTASTHTGFSTGYFDASACGSSVAYTFPVTGVSPQALRVGFISSAGAFGNTAALRTGAVRNTKPVAIFANAGGTAVTALFCIDASNRLGFTTFGVDAVEDVFGSVNNSDVTYYQCAGYWRSSGSWVAVWQGNTNTSTAKEAFEIRTAVHLLDGTQSVAPVTKRYNSYLVGAPFQVGTYPVSGLGIFFYLACPNPAGALAVTSDGSEHSLVVAFIDDVDTDYSAQSHKPVGCVMRGTGIGARAFCIKPIGSSSPIGRFSASDVQGSIIYYEMGSSGGGDTLLRYRNNHDANVQGHLYLGGAMSWQFDGVQAVENGFLHTPGMTGVSTPYVSQSTSGSLTQTGVYRYRIYYEYTDYLNRRAQSGFAYDFVVTLTGVNDDVTLTIPTLQWTRRTGDGVRIAVYRTEASGTVYYRIDSVRNNPSAASVTVLDTLADTAITDNELDYQSAGELDNVPFPATRAMAAAQDRLFGISAEQPTRVIYSKPLDGDGAAEFNEALYVEFPETLNAIATRGSTIYVFSESTVYAFAGEGPDITGSSGAFSSPIVVVNNAGCKLPRAVAEMPLGVLFVGDQGVWLLSDEGPRQVGDVLSRASTTSIPYLNTIGIHVLPDTNRVRILATNSSNTTVCLDWDYEFNQWSNHVFDFITDGYYPIGVVLCNGKYYIRDSGGDFNEFISRVDGGAFTDEAGSTAIALILKTAWIRPTGSALANCRATHGYILGADSGSGHSVTVEVAYDYSESFTTVGTFAATGFPQIRFRLPRISFRSIMFRITEVPDGSPGEGIELSALGLELAMEGTTGGRLLDS